MPDDRPIGIFDSGVGGLTVARAIMAQLPRESLVYLGDTARLPYGTKSPETVTRFSVQNVEYLRAAGVKAVVIACHTSSSVALPELAAHARVPLLGVTVPGSRQAAAASPSGRIGVIGTRATVASGAFQREIRRAREAIGLAAPEVHATPCPLFVPLVEEGWEGSEVARRVIEHYLAPFAAARVDCLVMGCTHYPVLRPQLQEVMGAGVALVDPGEETARELERLLDERGLRRESPGPAAHRFEVTDLTPRMNEMTRSFLGGAPPRVEHVPIERLEAMEVHVYGKGVA